MIVSESNLLKNGKEKYLEKTEWELTLLAQLNAFPVQRNSGIDGFLKEHFNNCPVPIKIQKDYETLEESIEKLEHAAINENFPLKIVVQTKKTQTTRFFPLETNVKIIQSLDVQCQKYMNNKLTVTNETTLHPASTRPKHNSQRTTIKK
jgi:site-specific DNA-methyltransferase (adenine-specific)